MKIKVFLIKINYIKWTAILFAFSFCLGIGFNSICYGLFLFTGLFFAIKDYKNLNLQHNFNELNLPLIIFFLMMLVREASDANPVLENVILKYSAFILLPIIISFHTKELKKHIHIIFYFFLVGAVISAIINLGFAIFRGFLINEAGINFWYFTYDFLAEPFGMQPIYLSFFYVFSLLILSYYNFFSKVKIFYYSLYFLFSISIFLLAARNAIVCLLVIVPLFLIIKKKLSYKRASIAILILGVCFFIAIKNPVVKNRIFKVNKVENVFSGTSLRISIWESAYVVSKKNILFGVGRNKGKLLLLDEFKRKNLTTPLMQRYHAHNQVLQTLMQYGIVGLVLLLLSFIWGMYWCFKRKNTLGVFLLIIFMISSITESIFMRQWGVFSFAFFVSLITLDEYNLKP